MDLLIKYMQSNGCRKINLRHLKRHFSVDLIQQKQANDRSTCCSSTSNRTNKVLQNSQHHAR